MVRLGFRKSQVVDHSCISNQASRGRLTVVSGDQRSMAKSHLVWFMSLPDLHGLAQDMLAFLYHPTTKGEGHWIDKFRVAATCPTAATCRIFLMVALMTARRGVAEEERYSISISMRIQPHVGMMPHRPSQTWVPAAFPLALLRQKLVHGVQACKVRGRRPLG